MAQIRWNPWNMDKFFEEDWEMPTIPGVSRLIGQGLNLYETEENVVAELAVPGIPEDRIDVSIDENGVVRVSGTWEENQTERTKRRYFMSSLSKTFNYSFRLPPTVVAEKEPDVELENGVLTVKFEKQQKQPPKKIKVKVAPKK